MKRQRHLTASENDHSLGAQASRKKHKGDVTRRVAFNNEGNEYHACNPNHILDDKDEVLLWYDEEELSRFRSDYDNGDQLLRDAAPDQFENLRDAMSKVYKSKKKNTDSVVQTLARFYKEAPEAVGVEYMALTTACLTDLASRSESLRATIQSTYKTKTKTFSPARARRVFSASRQLTKTSQSFAHKIACAQAQALGH